MQPLDRDYIEARHAQSLKMASETDDPCAAAVHREMAALYAQRLSEADGSIAREAPVR